MWQRIGFLILVLVLAGAATAENLESTPALKGDAHVGLHLGMPDGRDGGETIETAIVIPGLPFNDTGNTSDNIDDYDFSCPYDGSISPDVVYAYTPPTMLAVSVDLCGSGYDTKVYIFDSNLDVVACNDDFYLDDICGQYTSLIEDVVLEGGLTYYIVIDGYSGDSGDYNLEMLETTLYPPCNLDCPAEGIAEGEPPLMDGYVDIYNSGCGSDQGDLPMQALAGDENGDLVFCGVSGWYDQSSRDTDWFTLVIGAGGLVEWQLKAEQGLYGFLLGPPDCAEVGVVESILVENCEPATLTLQGAPGEVLWIWTGPSTYEPPIGFEGHEFRYICTFHGLEPGVVATEGTTFDRLKSLYR